MIQKIKDWFNKSPYPDYPENGDIHNGPKGKRMYDGVSWTSYSYCKDCDKLMMGSSSFFSQCAPCKWKCITPSSPSSPPKPSLGSCSKELDYMAIMGAKEKKVDLPWDCNKDLPWGQGDES